MIRDNIVIKLRVYLSIIKRRWPFIAIPVLTVFLITALQFRLPETTYRVGIRYIVGQPNPKRDLEIPVNREYDWLTSERVVMSVADWVNGSQFAQLVIDDLLANGLIDEEETQEDEDFGLVAISNGILASTLSSRLTIFVDADEEEQVELIANGVVRVLDEFAKGNLPTLPQLGDVPAQMMQLDVFTVEPITPLVNQFSDWQSRIIVAAISGLIFAFMIEYLDPRVYEKQQLEASHIPVLGSIPRELAKVDEES